MALGGLLLGCGSPSAPQERQEPRAAERPTASASPEDTTEPTTEPTPEPVRRAAPPTSVRIPSLGLDEELVELGIGADGELEVPEDPDRVGWFAGGGRPGGPGPTVLVGHVDSTTGPAVFARLPDLGPGDRVEVGAGARSTTYVVQEVADVPQQGFPTEQVFGATTDDVLRLITCTGPYDRAAGRYTENRVVTAVPAP